MSIENDRLRKQIDDLKMSAQRAENMYMEYKELMESLEIIKEKYSDAHKSLLQMKSTYSKKFKEQIKKVKKP